MNVNEDDNADLGEVNVGFTPRAGIDSVTYIKNQQERHLQSSHNTAHHQNQQQQYRNSAYQSTNPIYDHPDHAGLEQRDRATTTATGYSTSSRRAAAAATGYSASSNTIQATAANHGGGQRVASGAEGINLALSSLDDDEERLMARSTLTSDQSRVVSSRHLRDDYEAPRSYSYSYAYSKEFAANGLNNNNDKSATATSSTASHL